MVENHSILVSAETWTLEIKMKEQVVFVELLLILLIKIVSNWKYYVFWFNYAEKNHSDLPALGNKELKNLLENLLNLDALHSEDMRKRKGSFSIEGN